MRLILAIPAVSLLCTGAMHFNHTGEIAPKSANSIPAAAYVASPVAIWTDVTGPVYKDESVELRFSAPNPTFMGVVNPAGKFFYVIFPAAAAQGKLRPFVTSEQFAKLTRLSIPTARFKADPYTYGIEENQQVFTMSGTYRFIMGENLHTDDITTLQTVEIQYIHTPRPVAAVAVN